MEAQPSLRLILRTEYRQYGWSVGLLLLPTNPLYSRGGGGPLMTFSTLWLRTPKLTITGFLFEVDRPSTLAKASLRYRA